MRGISGISALSNSKEKERVPIHAKTSEQAADKDDSLTFFGTARRVVGTRQRNGKAEICVELVPTWIAKDKVSKTQHGLEMIEEFDDQHRRFTYYQPTEGELWSIWKEVPTSNNSAARFAPLFSEIVQCIKKQIKELVNSDSTGVGLTFAGKHSQASARTLLNDKDVDPGSTLRHIAFMVEEGLLNDDQKAEIGSIRFRYDFELKPFESSHWEGFRPGNCECCSRFSALQLRSSHSYS